MRQADVHEKAVRQLTNGMNLADIKIYADADGEVQAVWEGESAQGLGSPYQRSQRRAGTVVRLCPDPLWRRDRLEEERTWERREEMPRRS